MKILLVKPYLPYPYSSREYIHNRIWPPLCLANCAALLEREGHQVKILDACLERVKPDKIGRHLKGYDRVFVTTSSLDRWQCPNTDTSIIFDSIRHIKNVTDEVYVMGYHGTINPEYVLGHTKAKAVIRGEPENTVLEICRSKDLSGIKGISFADNGGFISNPDREPLDLKSLPVPAYHLLDLKRYFYEVLGSNFLLFELGRGCKYSCKFCNKVMYGEGVRCKSEAQIIKEVSTAVEKYNVKTAYFIDLDFLTNPEIAEKLCEYLIKKKYGLKWTCQARPDHLNPEILSKMKRAGCRLIHLGIEAGSQKDLDYLSKNMAIEDIENAVKLCKKAGLKTLGFYIFGLPGEDDQSREKTFNFTKKLNTDFVSFHKVFLYEGSSIHGEDSVSDGKADKFMRKGLARYYLRPSYLYRLDLFTILGGFRLWWSRVRGLFLGFYPCTMK